MSQRKATFSMWTSALIQIIGATIDTLQNGGPLQPAPIWLEVLIAALLAAGLVYTATIQSPGKRIATAALEFFVWLAVAVGLYVIWSVPTLPDDAPRAPRSLSG